MHNADTTFCSVSTTQEVSHCTWVEVPKSVTEITFRQHLPEGTALRGGEARLLDDVLGGRVVDVQVQVTDIQVSSVDDGLAGGEGAQVGAHVRLPVQYVDRRYTMKITTYGALMLCGKITLHHNLVK